MSYKNYVPLAICLAGILAYIVVFFVYFFKIRKAKRNIMRPVVIPRPARSFYGIFAAAFALEVLPVLVPLETWVIAVVCAVGVLGEYLAMRDRLEQIMKLYK